MKNIQFNMGNFKEIITNNFYYVDKTKAIEDIINLGARVILFTRPRRFGKTLFLSTLDYFFNLEDRDTNKKLFKNLYISQSNTFNHQGSYPVIHISLKDLESETFDGMLKSLKTKFIDILDTLTNFNDLSESLKISINDIIKEDPDMLALSLQIFTNAYFKHYQKKVILLIDEYEAPLIHAFKMGYHDKALNFFGRFYSAGLKTNPYLEKGILSGITQICQASIFSGLNNPKIYNYASLKFADTFGFTQEEVKDALEYFKLEEDSDQLKEYYDGYCFGECEVYNPWSIVNYLEERKLGYYWISTSKNVELINKLLKSANSKIKLDYIELVKGKTIKLRKTNPSNLVLSDLKNPEKLFNFMISTGYLSYNYQTNEVRVVNKEVLNSLPEITAEGLYSSSSDYNVIRDLLMGGELERAKDYFTSLFLDLYSYYNLPEKTDELYYHNILTTILYLLGIGVVKTNLEAGLGRFDIALISNNLDDYSYIIEVKKGKNDTELKALAARGVEQIKQKNYLNFLKNRHKKGIICFCFYKKTVEIKYELF